MNHETEIILKPGVMKTKHREFGAPNNAGASQTTSPTVAPLKPPTTASWASQLTADLSAECPPEDLAILKAQLVTISSTKSATVTALQNPAKPTIIRDQASLVLLASKVAAANELVVDLETQGLDPRKGEIVGIGIALPDATFYVPVNHRFETDSTLRPGQLPLIDVLEVLRLQEKGLIGHNAKYETKWLRHHGGITFQLAWDTMIAARLRRSDLPAGLKEVAVRELDVPDWGLTKAEIERIQYLPVDYVANYCAKDCWYTMLLCRRQRECLV